MDLLRCGADGSGGWRICLTTNCSLFSVGPFTTLMVFDLGNAAAGGGRTVRAGLAHTDAR